METPTVKILPALPVIMRTTQANGRAYQRAWEQFDRLSAKLRVAWKTKKSTLEILREERR